MKNFYQVYTDGAYSSKTKYGGWGWLAIISNENYLSDVCDYGGMKKTTNQRMEMTAIIKFLEYINGSGCKRVKIEINSDSMYSLGGIIGQIPRDKRSQKFLIEFPLKGWMGNWIKIVDDKIVWKTNQKNKDLWELMYKNLYELVLKKNLIYFGWVKGHSGNIGNEWADNLASLYPNQSFSEL